LLKPFQEASGYTGYNAHHVGVGLSMQNLCIIISQLYFLALCCESTLLRLISPNPHGAWKVYLTDAISYYLLTFMWAIGLNTALIRLSNRHRQSSPLLRFSNGLTPLL